MMFPEGTRSRNLEIGRFKEGAFKAAIDNKVPIIPIMLDGTGEVLAADGQKRKGRLKVTVKVLDEIPYEAFPSTDPSELKEYVKKIIADELSKNKLMIDD
jgi:1-acyl-sn-glycerol-3-phosphate acyltransferase